MRKSSLILLKATSFFLLLNPKLKTAIAKRRGLFRTNITPNGILPGPEQKSETKTEHSKVQIFTADSHIVKSIRVSEIATRFEQQREKEERKSPTMTTFPSLSSRMSPKKLPRKPGFSSKNNSPNSSPPLLERRENYYEKPHFSPSAALLRAKKAKEEILQQIEESKRQREKTQCQYQYQREKTRTQAEFEKTALLNEENAVAQTNTDSGSSFFTTTNTDSSSSTNSDSILDIGFSAMREMRSEKDNSMCGAEISTSLSEVSAAVTSRGSFSFPSKHRVSCEVEKATPGGEERVLTLRPRLHSSRSSGLVCEQDAQKTEHAEGQDYYIKRHDAVEETAAHNRRWLTQKPQSRTVTTSKKSEEFEIFSTPVKNKQPEEIARQVRTQNLWIEIKRRTKTRYATLEAECETMRKIATNFSRIELMTNNTNRCTHSDIEPEDKELSLRESSPRSPRRFSFDGRSQSQRDYDYACLWQSAELGTFSPGNSDEGTPCWLNGLQKCLQNCIPIWMLSERERVDLADAFSTGTGLLKKKTNRSQPWKTKKEWWVHVCAEEYGKKKNWRE